MYISYFNSIEGDIWNEETVRKRLSQMINIDGYFGLDILI